MERKPKKQSGLTGTRALEELQAAPATGEPRALLVRNQSTDVIVLRGDGTANQPDVVIDMLGEAVLAEGWQKNRSLWRLISNGAVSFEWVGPLHEARALPRVEDAPPEIVPENNFEREFARQISVQPEEQALASAAITVHLPDTREVDARYMKANFRRVLEYALWLEKRTQNRAKVIRTLSTRIDGLRAL